MPDSWKKWNIVALEPDNVMKHMSISTENDKSKKEFNLDELVAKATKDVQKSPEKKKKEEPEVATSDKKEQPTKMRNASIDDCDLPEPLTSPRVWHNLTCLMTLCSDYRTNI